MLDDVKKIAEHYGWGNQRIKAIEEMAELSVALAKNGTLANIKEEIADVYVMLRQLRFLLNISNDELRDMMCQKVERQLKRMEEER